MAFACKKEYFESLKNFENSEYLDPNNVLNKFQKANVLINLEQYEVGLAELEKLRIIMPRESPIPILIGKVYKKLDKIDKAHHYFSIALDLETRDTQRIKGLIESLHNSDSNQLFNEESEF